MGKDEYKSDKDPSVLQSILIGANGLGLCTGWGGVNAD